MGRHATLFLANIGLCLHVWLFLEVHSLSVPTASQLAQVQASAESASDVCRKRDVRERLAAEAAGRKLETPKPLEDLSASRAHDQQETVYDDSNDDDGEANRQITERKRLAHEEKRRLRLTKRHEYADRKYAEHVHLDGRLRHHSLRKRDVLSRNRRTLSTANAMQFLSDVAADYERRRLAAEMADRMTKAGKRSNNDIARYQETVLEEPNLVALLQRALTSK